MPDRPNRETVALELGPRSYDIVIEAGLLDNIGPALTPLLKNRRVFVVTEETVMHHQGTRLKKALESDNIDSHFFTLSAGEATKSFTNLENLVSDLLNSGIERNDVIVAFGGGVIGDLAGFAASVVLRGVGFIQVPTTLLAQVDSSVGGKTGINTPEGKNLAGAFYQPSGVFIDTDTLQTLRRRELLAGYAEVVKYGVIDDPAFFDWLEEHGQTLVALENSPEVEVIRTNAIAHSCRAKARVVAEDELETGKRALLNLGHTFGHALEAECGYGDQLLHGEAVAIGMVMALETSARIGLASHDECSRLTRHLQSVGLRTAASEVDMATDAERLLGHMHKDKKVEAGTIGFVLGGIGTAAVHRGVDLEIVRSVLHDSLTTG